jgi:hypothetical protein
MISIKKILSEVGEGSAKPFQLNRKGNFGPFFTALKSAAKDNDWTKTKKDFVYEVVSDKTKYLIKIQCIARKKNPMILVLPGTKKPKPPKDKYEMEVSIGFNVKRAREEYETNLNEMYRLMATIIEAVKDFINGVDEEVKLNTIHIYPKADEGDAGSVDSKRGRIYLSYIKKNISKLPGKWTAYQHSDRIEIRNGDWSGGDIIAKS